MTLEKSKLTPQDAAEKMFKLLAQGGAAARDAAVIMAGDLSRWMDGYFRRFGVPEQEANELTMDVWLKVLDRAYDVKSNGFALLCRMRKSRLADYVKQHRAAKRSDDSEFFAAQGAELAIDDMAWDALAEPVADETSDEVMDCVRRKMYVFQQISPARAELLELVAAGLSYREIACIVFNIEESAATTQKVNRIRNRIEEARKQAAPFFEECKAEAVSGYNAPERSLRRLPNFLDIKLHLPMPELASSRVLESGSLDHDELIEPIHAELIAMIERLRLARIGAEARPLVNPLSYLEELK